MAMGSLVGPLLANIFLSQYDDELAFNSTVYHRYVDNIIRTVRDGEIPYMCNIRPEDTYRRKTKQSLKTTG